MSKHRIVCVNHEEVPGHGHHHAHRHIVSVGTGNDPKHIERRWGVEEIVAGIDRGEDFYTEGTTSHKVAKVEKFRCEHCGGIHIRTHHDHVHDNNLDSLDHCPVEPKDHASRDRDDSKPQPDRRHA